MTQVTVMLAQAEIIYRVFFLSKSLLKLTGALDNYFQHQAGNRFNFLWIHIIFPICFSRSPFQASYCSINDPPLNGGVVNRTKLHPGSRLQFYCNRGYRLVGLSNATCRLDSTGLYQWDTPAPVCQGRQPKEVFKDLICILVILSVYLE